MATIALAWIPAFVFGNVFALFWLCVLLLKKSPRLAAAVSKISRVAFPASSLESPSELQTVVENFKKPSSVVTVDAEIEGDLEELSLDDALPSAECVRRHVARSQSVLIAPVSLEWRGVGCSYRTDTTVKTVLQGVSGIVKPREMMALMGPSGAGKSTLLDILTMRKNVGEIQGEILINGQQRNGDDLGNTAYVPQVTRHSAPHYLTAVQEDNFVPTMTVLETLTFYASLVLPKTISAAERRQRVMEVLEMVGLGEAKSTMVGGLLPGGIHFRGLSGGERRRLSIAVGVVSAPSVIFLDEPTSGLDSFAALNVMQYMRTLADCKGHTVIASIHQPRMSIWNMFDQALILSKGRMMYSGAVDGVIPWFTKELGYSYDPSVHGVISDFVIDLVSVGFNKPKEHYGESMQSLTDIQHASEAFIEAYNRDHGCHDKSAVAPSTVKAPTSHRFATGWFAQFLSLYWRSFLNITRNPADVAGRMLTFTYVAVFIGLIFYSLADGAESVITRLNLLYNSSSFYMFIPYISMSLFTSDRQFYSAEIQAKLYRPSAYYCSKVLASLPFSVANAAVFALVVYGLTGLRDDTTSILQNVIILVLESLIAIQVLYFAAMVTPNQDMAFMLAIAFTAVNILLSNFFIPFERINLSWVSGLRYLSAMGYTWNGLTKIEFQHRDFSCADGTASLFPDIQGTVQESLPNLNAAHAALFGDIAADPSPDCIVNTDQILKFFDIDTPFWMTVVILISYLGILHFLTFCGLKFVSYKDKK